MMKAFRYRLYPTRKQAEVLHQTLDLCRKLYNAGLEERKESWRMTARVSVEMTGNSAVINYAKPVGVHVSYNDQSAQLPEIKEIRPEYKEIYSQILQDTLKRVDKAFKAFFRRSRKAKNPGFPTISRHMIAMIASPIHRLRSSKASRIVNRKRESSAAKDRPYQSQAA